MEVEVGGLGGAGVGGVMNRASLARPANVGVVGDSGDVVGGVVRAKTGVCPARPVDVVEPWCLVGAVDGGVVDGANVGGLDCVVCRLAGV